MGGGMSFFFFSSRRRHTRYWRDWSSDVCSSDLSSRNPARSDPSNSSTESSASSHSWVSTGSRSWGMSASSCVSLVLPGASLSPRPRPVTGRDRKSTRLNSSHANISYAVFCLKKKKKHRVFAYHLGGTCTFAQFTQFIARSLLCCYSPIHLLNSSLTLSL